MPPVELLTISEQKGVRLRATVSEFWCCVAFSYSEPFQMYKKEFWL
ncbi:hypothetical protein CCAN12_730073 [Capnocytophaga canimorsus]|uniref:Uncharacterized protein n=1 Tax=Capnocytophaga canimorsus TaxID=28188 RepID=A0A0B7HFM4_9FLAO|nr:hypothetical protein CCAN12_730073 [Capnocytophaga canimorsus]